MAARKTNSKKTVSTSRKVDTSKIGISQKVSAPKRTTRRKSADKMVMSEMDMSESKPRTRIITRKYLYAVVAVLILIGLLFTASRFWIIAWVDNKPITKFELYSLLEKRDDGKTAEELIEGRLLISEGQKQKQAISEGEIDDEIKKVEQQQGGAAQLDQILAVNKISREDFRKLVQRQLLMRKLFGIGVNITDADVDKYIEDNKDSIPPDMLKDPESSEAAKLREGVKEQLKQVKINENYSKWLGEALKSSRVMRNVPEPAPAAPLTPPSNP